MIGPRYTIIHDSTRTLQFPDTRLTMELLDITSFPNHIRFAVADAESTLPSRCQFGGIVSYLVFDSYTATDPPLTVSANLSSRLSFYP